MNEVRDTDLAWAAGFLEADGSTTTSGTSFRIQLGQSGDEVPLQLQRFADIMGQNVNGPYKPYALSKKPTYQVTITGGKAKWAIRLLAPYMTEGGPKLQKAQTDLEKSHG